MHLIIREANRIAKAHYRKIRERYFLDFVFIHINRTGGSSIEKALGIRFQHDTAMEKLELLGPVFWKKKFTFSVVRNPWEKVSSHYHYRVMTNQTNLGRHPIGFNEWVVRAYGAQDPHYYDKPKMFMPQLDWITDAKGNIIVDYVARFENLENDFQQICRLLNRKKTVLPHLKKSGRGDYRQDYDTDAIEIVSNRFRKDIVQFDYIF